MNYNECIQFLQPFLLVFLLLLLLLLLNLKLPSSNSSKYHDPKKERRKWILIERNINDDNSHYSQNRLQNINVIPFWYFWKQFFFSANKHHYSFFKTVFRRVIESEWAREIEIYIEWRGGGGWIVKWENIQHHHQK